MAEEKRQHGNHPVKHRVIRALRGSRDHTRVIEDGVSETIGLAMRDAERLLDGAAVPVSDIIRSAIDGAVAAGADLADVAQGILVAHLRRSGQFPFGLSTTSLPEGGGIRT